MPTTQPKHVIILRWFARVASIPFFLITALLFLEDGFPFFLFAADPIHMSALSLMLLGFLVGWKWDGLGAALILVGFLVDWIWVSVQFGEIVWNMGPIISFFPMIGLIYLYCCWRSKKACSV